MRRLIRPHAVLAAELVLVLASACVSFDGTITSPGADAGSACAGGACVCGDGVVESSETCDPPETCAATCDDLEACTADSSAGSAATCDLVCLHQAISVCTPGDGCCPAGCDAGSDGDCSPLCGNGTVDADETCDPPGTCPTTCADGDACTLDTATGSASTCDLACSHPTITTCASGDGCCPAGCSPEADGDCSASCGNDVVETGETCDPPSSCPSCDDGDACTTDTTAGAAATCDLACDHATITACADADGCCPSGCTAATDSDCQGPACTDAASWPADWTTFETQVLTLVNQERAAGASCTEDGQTTSYPAVAALTMQNQLRQAARCHSLDMATNDFFSHTGSNGSTLADRIDATGYTWSALAENIAAGQATPADAVAAWMASTHGHCSAIMNGTYQQAGVGYVYDVSASYRSYWTIDFGTPR